MPETTGRTQRNVANTLVIVVGVILIGALLMFRYFGPWAWASLILPAVALIAATPFLAPMPAPGPSTARQDTPARGDNLP